MKNIGWHHKHPLGMIKGNRKVVYRQGARGQLSKLAINKGKNGNYVTYHSSDTGKYKHVNVNKLHSDIFKSSEVSFRKAELRNQNRNGVYVPPTSAHNPIISMSGYIMRGKNRGKHLRDLTLSTIEWYVENVKLSKNEIYEINAELKKRNA